MSDLKPNGVKIQLGNKEYGLRFTLNAIDDIQEQFNISIGGLADLLKDEMSRIRNLKILLAILINEDIECVAEENGEKPKRIDERFVGRHIDAGNMRGMMAAIIRAFTDSIPEGDEDDDPNPQSGQ
jgi:hypothetical protein